MTHLRRNHCLTWFRQIICGHCCISQITYSVKSYPENRVVFYFEWFGYYSSRFGNLFCIFRVSNRVSDCSKVTSNEFYFLVFFLSYGQNTSNTTDFIIMNVRCYTYNRILLVVVPISHSTYRLRFFPDSLRIFVLFFGGAITKFI